MYIIVSLSTSHCTLCSCNTLKDTLLICLQWARRCNTRGPSHERAQWPRYPRCIAITTVRMPFPGYRYAVLEATKPNVNHTAQTHAHTNAMELPWHMGTGYVQTAARTGMWAQTAAHQRQPSSRDLLLSINRSTSNMQQAVVVKIPVTGTTMKLACLTAVSYTWSPCMLGETGLPWLGAATTARKQRCLVSAAHRSHKTENQGRFPEMHDILTRFQWCRGPTRKGLQLQNQTRVTDLVHLHFGARASYVHPPSSNMIIVFA